MCLSSVDKGDYVIPSRIPQPYSLGECIFLLAHIEAVYQRSIVVRLDLHLEAKVEKLSVSTGSDMTLQKKNN